MLRLGRLKLLTSTAPPKGAPPSVDAATITWESRSGSPGGASGKLWAKPTYTVSLAVEVSTVRPVTDPSFGATPVLPLLLSTSVVFQLLPRSVVRARITLELARASPSP